MHPFVLQTFEAAQIIYVDGCVEAMLDFAEDNMYILGGVALGLAVPQVKCLPGSWHSICRYRLYMYTHTDTHTYVYTHIIYVDIDYTYICILLYTNNPDIPCIQL